MYATQNALTIIGTGNIEDVKAQNLLGSVIFIVEYPSTVNMINHKIDYLGLRVKSFFIFWENLFDFIKTRLYCLDMQGHKTYNLFCLSGRRISLDRAYLSAFILCLFHFHRTGGPPNTKMGDCYDGFPIFYLHQESIISPPSRAVFASFLAAGLYSLIT